MIVEAVVGPFDNDVIDAVAESGSDGLAITGEHHVVGASMEEKPGNFHAVALLDDRSHRLAEIVHKGLRERAVTSASVGQAAAPSSFAKALLASSLMS